MQISPLSPLRKTDKINEDPTMGLHLFGADEGTRAFGGAPRLTAQRAVNFAAYFFVPLQFDRKPIARAIASTLKPLRRFVNKTGER